MPLFQYFFWIFGCLQGSVKAIEENIYIIKAFPLIFDILGAWIICKRMANDEKRNIYFLLLLINPIFLYNSLLWGQVDAVHSFFILISCLFAIQGKIFNAIISFLIAINFKLQAIVYLPLIGLFLLPYLLDRKNISTLLTTLFSVVVLQLVIILPFWLNGGIKQLTSTVLGSFDSYGTLSANAFNIWQWIANDNTYHMMDDKIYWGLTAKFWGRILFYAFSIVLLLPLLLYQLNRVIGKAKVLGPDKLMDIGLIAGALVNMNLFFFCTGMHERYSHPTMLFTCAYAIKNKKWYLMILFLVAYFLNMEDVLRYLQWENYNTLIYDPRFVAALFFIFMSLMYKDLYTLYFCKK